MNTLDQVMNTGDVAANPMQGFTETVLHLTETVQEAANLLTSEAQKLANHEHIMAGADKPGHFMPGLGFEYDPVKKQHNVNGSAKFEAEMAALETRLGGEIAAKADLSLTVAATIGTTWSGSAPPYTQTVSVAGVTPASVVEVLLSTTATKAQVEAYQGLNWTDGGQTAGSITLRAWGKINTTSIPVTVIIRS